jgi:Flp pilus assembly protein TadB
MQFGFPALLFIVFLVLKLTEVVNWSWLWITSPLWIPLTLAVLLFTIALSLGSQRLKKFKKEWSDS